MKNISPSQQKYLLIFFFLLFGLSVSAQIVNIPDATLKSRLINYNNPVIDTNGDGEIQVAEAEAFDGDLNLQGDYYQDVIHNTTGLEAFTNVTYLDLSQNSIESMDFSPFVNLDSLNLQLNQFSSITISGLPNLKKVNLNSNFSLDAQSIEMSNLPGLDVLNIGSCGLDSFPGLLSLPNLKSLNLSQNSFPNSPSISQSDFPSLETLNVRGCSITSFNGIAGLTNLKRLYASGNYFDGTTPSPDVSTFTALEVLDIGNMLFTDVDLSNLSNLKELYLKQANSLSSLDVSSLSSLKVLEI